MLIVTPFVIRSACKKITCIITDTPKAVFFYLLDKFWGSKKYRGIASDSTVESDVDEGSVSIGHNCFIGENVEIGEGTIIEQNVSIVCPTIIGKNCLIHSGTVIGSDGFGFYISDDGIPEKVDHFGGVTIGDNVEIGANTCIDRGTIDNTYIGNNVKIDNLCHIAHNVIIEENSMVIAGAAICGSAHLHKGSYVAPGGIIKNQVETGENSYVGFGAVVTKNIECDTVVIGVPAKPIRRVKDSDK